MHWDDPEGWDGEGGGSGGSGWGTHINPWLVHVNVWQKPLQYCKVVSLQLIKIIGKKKEMLLVLLCLFIHMLLINKACLFICFFHMAFCVIV